MAGGFVSLYICSWGPQEHIYKDTKPPATKPELEKSSQLYTTVTVTLYWMLNSCNLNHTLTSFYIPNQIFGCAPVARPYRAVHNTQCPTRSGFYLASAAAWSTTVGCIQLRTLATWWWWWWCIRCCIAPAPAPAPTPGPNREGSSFRLECIRDCIVSCRPNIIVSGSGCDARLEANRKWMTD